MFPPSQRELLDKIANRPDASSHIAEIMNLYSTGIAHDRHLPWDDLRFRLPPRESLTKNGGSQSRSHARAYSVDCLS